jgi:phosphotransferase system HPr (HPr) family protein
MSPQDPVTLRVILLDPGGLNLRKCVDIVHTLQRHRAQVTIRRDERVEDAASILGLMSLAAPCGTEVLLSATGPTAIAAVEDVAQVLADIALETL